MRTLLFIILHLHPHPHWVGMHPVCPRGYTVYADEQRALAGKDCAICVRDVVVASNK